jgi:hypothetical protein
VELKEMLAEASDEYSAYVREQAKLSRQGKADPEFMVMMQQAANFEDEVWQNLSKTRRRKTAKRRMRKLSFHNWDNVALPAVPARKVPSEVEQDARLFEKGADWLEENTWTRGWRQSIELPDGRQVDARCALGSILAVMPLYENLDGGPNDEGERRLNQALGRVGMETSEVIAWNDRHAETLQEVARYLRGLAYRIREGF